MKSLLVLIGIVIAVVLSSFIHQSVSDTRIINMAFSKERKVVFSDMYLQFSCDQNHRTAQVNQLLDKVIAQAKTGASNLDDLAYIAETSPTGPKDLFTKNIVNFYQNVSNVEVSCIYGDQERFRALAKIFVEGQEKDTRGVLAFAGEGENIKLDFRPEQDVDYISKSIAMWWSYRGDEKAGFLTSWQLLAKAGGQFSKLVTADVEAPTNARFIFRWHEAGTDSDFLDLFSDSQSVASKSDGEAYASLFSSRSKDTINEQLKNIPPSALQQYWDYIAQRELIGLIDAGIVALYYISGTDKTHVEYGAQEDGEYQYIGVASIPYWENFVNHFEVFANPGADESGKIERSSVSVLSNIFGDLIIYLIVGVLVGGIAGVVLVRRT